MKNRKLFLRTVVFICVVLLISVSVGCTPAFKDAPEGLSMDNRTYQKIKDKRMDAEAPDYKGYIFKKGDEAFCFRLKSPKNLEEGKTYPMIIFLHGSGDWGTDNSSHMYKSVIDNIEKYVKEDVFVFMPQAIKKYSWEKDYKKYKGMDTLYNLALDELLSKNPIDKSRVYLTGMSMGGYGSYFQAYNNPNKYAAVMPICGYFPEEVFSDLSYMKNMPTWLGHSRTDDAVEFSNSENLYNRLIEAGGADINKTWLDDYKHDMTEPFYNNVELWNWLMKQKKA